MKVLLDTRVPAPAAARRLQCALPHPTYGYSAFIVELGWRTYIRRRYHRLPRLLTVYDALERPSTAMVVQRPYDRLFPIVHPLRQLSTGELAGRYRSFDPLGVRDVKSPVPSGGSDKGHSMNVKNLLFNQDLQRDRKAVRALARE